MRRSNLRRSQLPLGGVSIGNEGRDDIATGDPGADLDAHFRNGPRDSGSDNTGTLRDQSSNDRCRLSKSFRTHGVNLNRHTLIGRQSKRRPDERKQKGNPAQLPWSSLPFRHAR
jgi:hypothetical protein